MISPGFYALVGPNAAGKTHYLRSLFGPGAAFVPAGADALFVGRTAGDHIAWAREAKPLGEVTVDFPLDTPIKKLSVGQRRSLTFTVALAADEPLLLLDEPFDGLDIDTRTHLRHRLIDYLSRSPERTVIMASHRSEDLAGLADHAICVHERHVGEPVALEAVRESFPVVAGEKGDVDKLIAGRDVVETSALGSRVRAQLAEPVDAPATVTVTYPDDAALLDLLAARKD